MEYMGPDGFVGAEAIVSLLNFNKVKLISSSVAYINILEFLWNLTSNSRYDLLTLTTSVFTFGNDGLKTSAKIMDELARKFKKFIVYTVSEDQSLPVRRIPLDL